jgi:hypothetical protein
MFSLLEQHVSSLLVAYFVGNLSGLLNKYQPHDTRGILLEFNASESSADTLSMFDSNKP